jgi:hypothetical protein
MFLLLVSPFSWRDWEYWAKMLKVLMWRLAKNISKAALLTLAFMDTSNYIQFRNSTPARNTGGGPEYNNGVGFQV